MLILLQNVVPELRDHLPDLKSFQISILFFHEVLIDGQKN